jgi:acyl carrier protein
MTREEILPILVEMARDVIGEGDLAIPTDAAFSEIEGWDSLSHLHIVVGLEKSLGIKFVDAAGLQGATTVADLLDLIATAPAS